MADVAPDRVFQVASSFMAAKYLFVATEVGLFEQLAEGPATLDELARRIAVPRRTTRLLVDAMVALGFVERQGDRYQNAAVAATFLSGRTPADLRPHLRFWNRISFPRWGKLEEAVRTARPVFGDLALTEEEQAVFSRGVEAFSAGAAQALATAYDFAPHTRVLDLGGGTGSFLRAILRQHPNVDATLFELRAAAAVARQRLAGDPLAARLRIVEGDFFADPIPEGHDAVIVANVAHLFLPERNLELLRRIRARVGAGARLLLVDLWTDPAHTQPLLAALLAGEFLLFTGTGDVYSAEEAQGWLEQTGWRPISHAPLAGPSSLIVAEAAAP
jgi:SAM-dependent methyltransferase